MVVVEVNQNFAHELTVLRIASVLKIHSSEEELADDDATYW